MLSPRFSIENFWTAYCQLNLLNRVFAVNVEPWVKP
jgi:hypothetical protein